MTRAKYRNFFGAEIMKLTQILGLALVGAALNSCTTTGNQTGNDMWNPTQRYGNVQQNDKPANQEKPQVAPWVGPQLESKVSAVKQYDLHLTIKQAELDAFQNLGYDQRLSMVERMAAETQPVLKQLKCYCGCEMDLAECAVKMPSCRGCGDQIYSGYAMAFDNKNIDEIIKGNEALYKPKE